VPARILLIEDNLANLDLMVYLLEAFGHTTLASHDGEEGLRMASREKPDLIICDVHLPGIDGYEVVRTLKAGPECRAIPVLAVTALAMGGSADAVLEAGFDGYLAKPIDPETFVRQIAAFLKPENLDLPRAILEPSGYTANTSCAPAEATEKARQDTPE